MIELNLNERARDDLIIVSSKLLDCGVLQSGQEVIDFFEKPWKWSEEYKDIINNEKNIK